MLALARNSTLYVHTQEATQTFIGLIELKAQILAYHEIFLTGTVILALGAIASLWLHVPEKKLDGPIMVE